MEYSKIHINGYQVDHFHYNDGKKQIEAYDKFGRVIATYEMSEEQWVEISKLSYASCWEELGKLFGDVE